METDFNFAEEEEFFSYEKFSDFATKAQILSAFKSCIRRPSVGKDGIKLSRFLENQEIELALIFNRIQNNAYIFTPYLEKLIPKKYDSYPRRIAIPTIRDKIALKVMHNYLKLIFIDEAKSKHQLSIIDILKSKVSSFPFYVRFDFSSFYDSIPHKRLIELLGSKLSNEYDLKFIRYAINNSISPLGKGRERSIRTHGLPQGLSISNILANIFAGEIDKRMTTFEYYRYVDDVIILCKSKEEVMQVIYHMNLVALELGLSINESKSRFGETKEGFEFLGYEYSSNGWIIKHDTFSRHFSALQSIFTKFKYDLIEVRHSHVKTSKRIIYAKFIDDLNNKIAGAIYKGNKHGFVFYFSKITSVRQLMHLDAYVAENMKSFKGMRYKGVNVKTHVESYYAWRSNNPEAYITQYGKETTTEEKYNYLFKRNLLYKPIHKYRSSYVNSLYDRYIWKKLRKIDEFTGTLS